MSSVRCPLPLARPATRRARFSPARAWTRRSRPRPSSQGWARPDFCRCTRVAIRTRRGGQFSVLLGSRGQRGLGAPAAQEPQPSCWGRVGSLGGHLPWGRWEPGRSAPRGAAALCSPDPRGRCLSDLAWWAGGACTLSRRELGLLQYSGVGFRSPCLTEQRGAGAAKNRGLRPFRVCFLPVNPARSAVFQRRERSRLACPRGLGCSAQLLASQRERTRGLAWVPSPRASAGPGGCHLRAERTQASSLGLKAPPEPGPPPFVRILAGWGGLSVELLLAGPPGPGAA